MLALPGARGEIHATHATGRAHGAALTGGAPGAGAGALFLSVSRALHLNSIGVSRDSGHGPTVFWALIYGITPSLHQAQRRSALLTLTRWAVMPGLTVVEFPP